jgi:hypothetical protein
LPPKVYPLPEEFWEFDRQMLALGFRRITRIEFSNTYHRFGLVAPSPRKGREVGYAYSANGLIGKIWSSWLPEEETIRDEDAGWALIEEGDRAVYFAPPLNRTKNFLSTLLKYAYVVRWRVLYRHLCPQCHEFMHIAKGKHPKQVYWICRRWQHHVGRHFIFRDWDWGLPPRMKKFLMERRKIRALYRKDLADRGIVVVRALFRRTGWKKTRNIGAG